MFTAKKCNSAAAIALLGGLYCTIGKMVGIALWKKGSEIPLTFGKTDLDTKVLAGEFLGAIMADSLENNDVDPNMKETLMKIRNQTDSGRKGFNLTFEKTPCFHNELNKLNNSENWDFTPILDDGSIFAYQTADGKVKGFSSKLFVGLYKLPIMGVEEQGTVLSIDLMPKAIGNWQNNGVVLENDEIDFTEVQPIAGLTIDTPILTAGATTTQISVLSLCSDSVITGLTTATNWKVNVNGTLTSPSAVSYDAVNKKYTLTHAALVAGQKVSFLTSANGQNVVVLDNTYYSGTSATKTVA